MDKKTIHNVNGGLAIYYGIGFAVLAIVGLVVLLITVVKSITGATGFSLWGTLWLAAFSVAMGLIAYAILRVGYEEMEK